MPSKREAYLLGLRIQRRTSSFNPVLVEVLGHRDGRVVTRAPLPICVGIWKRGKEGLVEIGGRDSRARWLTILSTFDCLRLSRCVIVSNAIVEIALDIGAETNSSLNKMSPIAHKGEDILFFTSGS